MASRTGSLYELDETTYSLDPEHDDGLLRLLENDGAGPEPRLCDRCSRFDIQAFARSKDRRRGYMLREVEAGARAPDPCEFCALLFDSVKDVPAPKDVQETRFTRRSTTKAEEPDLYVHMTLSADYSRPNAVRAPSALGLRANRLRTEVADRFSEVRNASDHELCLVAELESAAATNGDIVGRYVGDDPGSEAHFDMIRTWIQECAAHPKCNQTVSGSDIIDTRSSPLPARCIEISRDGSGAPLRLVQTNGMYGAYITLSHRWNEETAACKTIPANFEDRLLGRGLDSLPQIFKDTFYVASKLGLRYVWIDSLCIIQDGGDWIAEAPKMAQYYQFSLLTISGTMRDVKNGLLCSYPQESTPWESNLVRMPYRNDEGVKVGHFYVYKRRTPLLDDFRASVRESRLSRRGWILQEWLLSKRILWYTSRGLFFECHTEGPRTEYQEQIRAETARADLRSHLQLKPSFHFQSASIIDFWYSALEVYSACDLTQPDQDRVLAVTGLAKEVGLILSRKSRESADQEVYLSGLWLRDLHRGLLWEADCQLDTRKVQGAPSWSWASLMAPVRWAQPSKGVKNAFKVEGICLSQRLNHATAEFTVGKDGRMVRSATDSETPTPLFDPTNLSACLHIRGKLRPVHVRGYLETKDNLETAAFATAYGSSHISDWWRAICVPQNPEVIAGWGSLEQLESMSDSCDDAVTVVYALHVSTRYLRTGLLLKHADPVLDVLFLAKLNLEESKFRRVGVGRVFAAELRSEFDTAREQTIQLV